MLFFFMSVALKYSEVKSFFNWISTLERGVYIHGVGVY